ncbi:hypothetical protein CBL_05062 [Carabus blaptoides fortunei]
MCVRPTKTDRSKKIFGMTSTLHLRVKVENYRARNEISQCYRCQQFGHATRGCRAGPNQLIHKHLRAVNYQCQSRTQCQCSKVKDITVHHNPVPGMDPQLDSNIAQLQSLPVTTREQMPN